MIKKSNFKLETLLSTNVEDALMRLELEKIEQIHEKEDKLSQQASDEEFHEKQLWVDKYKSDKFFDLLTPESLNRNVLLWVKSWDKYVFPERASDLSALQPKRSNGLTNTTKAFYQSPQEEFSLENRKLIILHGPPGTGKSTMAKVIAKVCGYSPREINGSDVRSPKELIEQIKNALQSNSHFTTVGQTQDLGKPVCLIIDEVDGALQGGVGQGFSKVVEFLKQGIQNFESKHKSTAIPEVEH